MELLSHEHSTWRGAVRQQHLRFIFQYIIFSPTYNLHILQNVCIWKTFLYLEFVYRKQDMKTETLVRYENTFVIHANKKYLDFFAQACDLKSYIPEHLIFVSDFPQYCFLFSFSWWKSLKWRAQAGFFCIK